MIIFMPTSARSQQRYDHRLRNLVQRSADVTVATDLGVPRSTARGWLTATPTVVVCRKNSRCAAARDHHSRFIESQSARQPKSFPLSRADEAPTRDAAGVLMYGPLSRVFARSVTEGQF
jgi:hypothetical protein